MKRTIITSICYKPPETLKTCRARWTDHLLIRWSWTFPPAYTEIFNPKMAINHKNRAEHQSISTFWGLVLSHLRTFIYKPLHILEADYSLFQIGYQWQRSILLSECDSVNYWTAAPSKSVGPERAPFELGIIEEYEIVYSFPWCRLPISKLTTLFKKKRCNKNAYFSTNQPNTPQAFVKVFQTFSPFLPEGIYRLKSFEAR